MTVMGIGNSASGIGKKWEWEWFCGNAREWEQKQSFPHTAIGWIEKDVLSVTRGGRPWQLRSSSLMQC